MIKQHSRKNKTQSCQFNLITSGKQSEEVEGEENVKEEEDDVAVSKESQQKKKPKEKKKVVVEKEEVESANEEVAENSKVEAKVAKESTKKKDQSDPKTELQRTIVLTGLTSKVKRKAFRILCEKFGQIENIVYPVPERTEVTAFIRFKDYKSTIRAVQKIEGLKVKKSNRLSAVLLTKEGRFPKRRTLDKSRLIVRNLSFKVEADELKDTFSSYGKVLDVSIPTKKVGDRQVKIGCAFVQFDNPAHGLAALQGVNMTEIKGRAVIVDWALKKEDYQNAKAKGKLFLFSICKTVIQVFIPF